VEGYDMDERGNLLDEWAGQLNSIPIAHPFAAFFSVSYSLIKEN
jgi:hypothetical protein